MKARLRILLLNAFHGGSHAQWASAFAKTSRHNVTLYTLPGRQWKWRMHGAAVHLAQIIPTLPFPDQAFDVLVVTDMLDLATLRGLRPDLASLPCVSYFHENQLSYPWSADDPDLSNGRDLHYGWINYTSALAADELWMASAFHARSWQQALEQYLHRLPEGRQLTIPSKPPRILPLPLQLASLATGTRAGHRERPRIVWNHRWEYDKGPDLFFRLLDRLDEAGFDFELIVMGEHYHRSPVIFAEARQRHAWRIHHWGYVVDRSAYEALLLQADLALVTCSQDFFGISVVEAMAAGAVPVLPKGMPYQEHLLPNDWEAHSYADEEEALAMCMRQLLALKVPDPDRESDTQHRRAHLLSRYAPDKVLSLYDERLEGLAARSAS